MPPSLRDSDKGSGHEDTWRGSNLVIEYRSAEGRDERFAGLAADLVRLKVDMIGLEERPQCWRIRTASNTTPVIITGVGDPVAQGIVATLARPGANVTGLRPGCSRRPIRKRIELLKELVPKAARIAALFNMGNPAIPPQWKEVETAVRSLGLPGQLLDVRKPEDLRAGVRCRHSAALLTR